MNMPLQTKRQNIEKAAYLLRFHQKIEIKLSNSREMGNSLYNAPPYRFSRSPNQLRAPAPLLGQHTEEICRTVLGMTQTEIDALREDGVLQ